MITFERLSRRYGSFSAVDDISFEARPGTVTGFLGPNGAGKSTSLRILVGLTAPTSGTALVLGRPYAELANPGRQVGVLLDASAQHGGRTGREVLTLAALVMGVGRQRVEEVLRQVGLGEAESRRRVRHYSLGMRQRLGLAHALLGDPGVLVLDEPANGLDPAGISWMRGLVRGFADRGGTVLLSSHLLREVEVVADELVLINHGRLVARGATSELLAGTGTVASSTEADALASALDRAGLRVSWTDRTSLLVGADSTVVGRIAADAGIALTSLRPADRTGLEDLFLALTSDDAQTEDAA